MTILEWAQLLEENRTALASMTRHSEPVTAFINENEQLLASIQKLSDRVHANNDLIRLVERIQQNEIPLERIMKQSSFLQNIPIADYAVARERSSVKHRRKRNIRKAMDDTWNEYTGFEKSFICTVAGILYCDLPDSLKCEAKLLIFALALVYVLVAKAQETKSRNE